MARHANQLDLLRDWTPPAAVSRFDAQRVRASTIPDLICRGVSESLRDTDQKREDVARRMSDYLGQPVSVHMLNAYASPAREAHAISVARYAALVHATNDRRLLQLLAEPQRWAVIDGGLLPMIELAAITEHQAELARRAEMLRRQVRQRGA